jgi:hypothetical protein
MGSPMSVCRIFRRGTQPAWPGVIIPTVVLMTWDGIGTRMTQ